MPTLHSEGLVEASTALVFYAQKLITKSDMMKKLFSLFLSMTLGMGFMFGQNITFEAPSTVFSGPFLEMTDDGFTLYSWYKRSGFMSKKIKGFSSGNEAVQVSFLEIQRFSKSGELLGKESHPVRMEDKGSLIAKYQVHEKSLRRGDVIASEDDLTMKDLVKKFPNSLKHSGGGSTESAPANYVVVNVSGKGLIGSKKPYSITVEKNGEEVLNKEVPDIPTGNPKAEWKTLPESKFYRADEESVVFPTWYRKYVKKDRMSSFKGFKLVGYDRDGKVLGDKELTFDVPHEIFRNVDIYDNTGIRKGHLFVLGELYGFGYKKANPEPNKDLNLVYWMDGEGKIHDAVELRARGKDDFRGSPTIAGAFQDENGLRLLIPAYKDKDKGVDEAALDEYLIKDGKSELVKTYKYEDILRNADGEKNKFTAAKMKSYRTKLQLEDGGVLYAGCSTFTQDQKPVNGDCFYMITNADGSVRYIGEIKRGVQATQKAPGMQLEALEEGRVLVKIKNHGYGIKLLVCDTKAGKFTPVKPKTEMDLKELMRKDDSIYFIGITDAEKGTWMIEEFKL